MSEKGKSSRKDKHNLGTEAESHSAAISKPASTKTTVDEVYKNIEELNMMFGTQSLINNGESQNTIIELAGDVINSKPALSPTIDEANSPDNGRKKSKPTN